MHVVVSSPQITVLEHPDGTVAIEPLAGPEKRLRLRPSSRLTAGRLGWTTRYPLDLIHEIFATKGLYICDEIMREEDPHYVEHFLRSQVLTYVQPSAFAGKRVLDFGCGSGASTVVLSRLLPRSEIVGVELEERLLRIARLRATHFGLRNVRFLRSPRGDQLPEDIGTFDFIMFSAVFEHLLPPERQALLPLVFSRLNPGGALFLNQTPHRYSPVEMHTTGGLPFINYLPSRLTLAVARRFSKYVRPTDDWPKLLRAGIRGGTVREIMRILRHHDQATLLRPIDGDRIDQWYDGLSKRHAWLKRSLWLSLKCLKLVTRIELTPALALAIRKDP